MINIGAGFSFRPWDETQLTKTQARNLIKWFLGHKYDHFGLPFSRERRNKIRTKKALRTTIVHGIKDNLSALRLLDAYGLLDTRNAKRQRKVHLKSKWTDKQIAEEFLDMEFGPSGKLHSSERNTVIQIRRLLKKIEKLEDKLGRKWKRKRGDWR
ncbi:MAG: hypothetical protein V3U54_08440 [Thermodesulfobacteriota bacterium]